MKTMGMKGMTLLELLFVMAVAAILSGFAFLSADMVRREKVHAAARELYADIQKIRLDSMTGSGKGYGIRFESPQSYVIFKFEDCNEDYTYDVNSCPGGTREESEIVRRTLPAGVALLKTNGSSVRNDVRIFDTFGSPRQTTWGLGLITILITNEPDAGLTKCVSVSMNRVRESVWNGSECSS